MADIQIVLWSVLLECFAVFVVNLGNRSLIFKPHGFCEHDFKKVCNNKFILTFVAYDNDEITGYFFLRCFWGGKAFRGKIVDAQHQGLEIATEMGTIFTLIAHHLHLRVFGSISNDNYALLASAKKTNNLKIIKTLDNGYYYIEFTEKHM